MSLSFEREIKSEYGKIIERGNEAVIRVSKGMWRVAVDATPRDTGRAKNGWRLNTGQGSGLIPAMGKYGIPKVPNFTFDFRKNPLIRLYNNVPYISYLEHGQGKGNRYPHKMLFKAGIYYNAHMQRELNKIR